MRGMADDRTQEPANDSKKMRDEIRSKLESDVDAAIKDAKSRVKPPAPPAQQDAPTTQGVCWACGGTGRCQVCHGRGCGYCKAGACGSCNGHGST
jgi:hypothetical protein